MYRVSAGAGQDIQVSIFKEAGNARGKNKEEMLGIKLEKQNISPQYLFAKSTMIGADSVTL